MNLLLILGLVWLSKLVKFSLIVGSVCTFFSLINVVAPLTVLFSGWGGGVFCMLLTGLLGTKSIVGTSLLAACGLPNFGAGLYLRTANNLFKIALPALCMALFWYQTWGTIGMAYALLWLIPVAVTVFKIEQIYLKSLAATFVAHGIGSVMWVYGANLTPEQWFALIPVAICERVLLACLIGVAYNLVQSRAALGSFYNKIILRAESALL